MGDQGILNLSFLSSILLIHLLVLLKLPFTRVITRQPNTQAAYLHLASSLFTEKRHHKTHPPAVKSKAQHQKHCFVPTVILLLYSSAQASLAACIFFPRLVPRNCKSEAAIPFLSIFDRQHQKKHHQENKHDNSSQRIVVGPPGSKGDEATGNPACFTQKMSLKRSGSSSSSSAGSKPSDLLVLKRKTPDSGTTDGEGPFTSVIRARMQDLDRFQQPAYQHQAITTAHLSHFETHRADELRSQAAQLQAAQLQGAQLQAQLQAQQQAQQQAQSLQFRQSSLAAALTFGGGGVASLGAASLSRSTSHSGPAPGPNMSLTGGTRRTAQQEQMQYLLLSGRLPPSEVNLALAGLASAPAPPTTRTAADLLRSRSLLAGQSPLLDTACLALDYPRSTLNLLGGNNNPFPAAAAGVPLTPISSQVRTAQLMALQAEFSSLQQGSSAGGVTESAAAAAGLMGVSGPSNILNAYQQQLLLRQLRESDVRSNAFGDTAGCTSNNRVGTTSTAEYTSNIRVGAASTVTLSSGAAPIAPSAESVNKRVRRSTPLEPASAPKETMLAVAGAIPPALPPAAKGATPHYSERLFISLATDEDQNWLSEFQVWFVLANIGVSRLIDSRCDSSEKSPNTPNTLLLFAPILQISTECLLSPVLYPLGNP